jgi:hypothetical protein
MAKYQPLRNLKRHCFSFLLIVSFSFYSNTSNAWGPEGHAIVGRLAMHFVKDDVRKNVLALLGKMSIDTAANWMDIMKSNSDYDFMRTWHYLDFPKNKVYTPTNEENIVNRLLLTFNELKHKNTLCESQIQTDLYILLHLMDDVHMPLHTGYDDDLGGNRVMVQYDTLKNHNLHRFWDEDIIRLTKITYEDVLQFNTTAPVKDTIGAIDFVRWMQESRSLLPQVYDFPGFMIDDAYLKRNKVIVQRQLVVAGMRLAAILDKLFYSAAPEIDFKAAVNKYKNGIDVKDAKDHLGKEVSVCSKVYSIRSTDKITQISVGDKFPNNPLTVIIFGSSYSKFKLNPGEMFANKNICVTGKIEDYKGKLQIIVNSPEDITIL